MTSNRFRQGFPVLFLFLLWLASPAAAQSPNASISGIVTDPTGSVVPNAKVTLTNISTSVAESTQTNGEGLYRVPDVIPGVYRINITAEGFKSVVKDQVELHVQEAVSLNFSLELGSTTESVTVSAGAPLIDTQSTSLGSIVEGRQVQDTPLNGRNPMNLIALVPTVVPQGTTGGSASSNQAAGFVNPAGFGNYQIGGGIAGWNATYVDGVPVNASGQNWQALIPTQDSVGEFKVDTNSVTPQYGRFAGGVVNFSTKSGGNGYHGTAYDYLRNTVLDANTFFNKLASPVLPRNVLEQNQFGADLGGPIKKDKTFFFFSWEATRLATSSAFQNYVPTPAEISGDFRNSPATLSTMGKSYCNRSANPACTPVVYPQGYSIDPKTGNVASCNGVVDTICANELDQTAQAMYANGYYAPPNPALIAQLVSNAQNGTSVGNNTPGHPVDIVGVTKQANNAQQFVTRVDQQLSDKQRLFGRYTHWGIDIPTPTGQQASPIFTLGRPDTVKLTTNQAVFGDTYTFSPSMTADFRLGYTRFMYDVGLAANGKADLSVYGPNWAAIGNQIPVKAPPSFFPSGSWPDMPGSLNLQQHNHNDIYTVSGSMIKIVGRHTLAFGGEARRVEYYSGTSIYPSGNFNFLGQNGIENFVEGAVTPGFFADNITVSVAPSAYSYYEGLYVTDTFQVSSKLTANYGVRWEIPGTWYTRGDRSSVLLPNKANPLGTFVNPATGQTQQLTGELVAVNSADYPHEGQTQNHLHLFEPRVGVDYAVTQNMVLRAGFGISAPCLDCGSVSTEAGSSPFASAVTLDSNSLSNPFPNGVLLPLRRSLQVMQPYPQFHQTLLGAVVGGQVPNQKYPYVMQWNANVERAFGSSVSLMLSYSGSRGVHLGSGNVNLNQLPDQFDSIGGNCNRALPLTGLCAQLANPLQPDATPTSTFLAGPTANRGQFLEPYPEFSQFNSFGPYYGMSYYNALIFQAHKRFAHGASLNVAYTWSHFMSNVDSSNGYLEPGQSQTGFGPQDYTNPAGDRSNSAADVPQRLVISYIVDLPFGRGRRFLSSASPVVDHLVSGWTLSGITTFSSGLPLGLTVNGGNSLSSFFGAGTIRPNFVAGCNRTTTGSVEQLVATGKPVFNTACFVAPPDFTFGNESRLDGTLRSQGIKNFDADLGKATKVTERVALQFDAQFFNLFNRVQFGPPNTAVGAGNFGIVSSTVGQPRIAQLSLRLTF